MLILSDRRCLKDLDTLTPGCHFGNLQVLLKRIRGKLQPSWRMKLLLKETAILGTIAKDFLTRSQNCLDHESAHTQIPGSLWQGDNTTKV
jgi:hypothetical protein